MNIFLFSAVRSEVGVFDGIECHQNSLYPASTCPLSGLCCCNSTCVAWKRGKLNLYPNETIPAIMPKCDTYDMDGVFFHGLWQYSNESCKLRAYSTSQAHQLLSGHQVTFAGDSAIRQLFLRLVWHLRGIETIAEHYFHQNACYFSNSTHDVFLIGGRAVLDANEMIIGATVKLIYVWSAYVGPQSRLINSFQGVETGITKIVVFGVNHWDPDGEDGTDYTFQRTSEEIEPITQTARFILYATPELNELSGDCFTVPTKYTFKNKFFRDWMTRHGNLVIPVDKMERTHVFKRNTEDNLHYQCSFLAPSHQVIRLDEFKMPSTSDCRDLFNFNILQIIMNMIA